MKQPRGIIWLPILLSVLAALVVSGGVYFVTHQNKFHGLISIVSQPAATSTPETNIAPSAQAVSAQNSHGQMTATPGNASLQWKFNIAGNFGMIQDSYRIDFGDGVQADLTTCPGSSSENPTCTQFNVVHTYARSGNYQVRFYTTTSGLPTSGTRDLISLQLNTSATKSDASTATPASSDVNREQHVVFRSNQSALEYGMVVIGTDGKLDGTIDVTGWSLKGTISGSSFTIGSVGSKHIVLENLPGMPSSIYISAVGSPANNKLQPARGTEDPSDFLKYVVYLGARQNPWASPNESLQLFDAGGRLVATYKPL